MKQVPVAFMLKLFGAVAICNSGYLGTKRDKHVYSFYVKYVLNMCLM